MAQIELEVVAEIERYQREIAQIPGVTDKAAARAAIAFVKQQRKAQADAVKAARTAATQAADSWTDAFRGAGSVLAGALSADLIKQAAGSVFGFAGELADARNELLQLSAATGVGAQTLAGIDLAAKKAGLEFGDLAGGVEDFGEKMFDASRGSGAALEAFELLGFSSADLTSRMDDTDGVLQEVIAGMQGTEDAALKNTIAQQLFGDAGNRLAAALGDVPLEAFVEQSREFGLDVGPEAAAQSRAFAAASAELGEVLRGAAADLVDFLELGERIRSFTLGFVFLKDFAATATTEIVADLDRLGRAVGALTRGNFELVRSIAEEQRAADELGSPFERARQHAVNTAFQFFELSKATDQAAEGAGVLRTELGRLSEEEERATKEAESLARAQAKLSADTRKAQGELTTTIAELRSDTLTAEQEIQKARAETIIQIGETVRELQRLAAEGQDVAVDLQIAEVARVEAIKREERDLAALRDEQLEKRLEELEERKAAEVEVQEALRELEEEAADARREQFEDALGLAEDLAASLIALAEEVTRRRSEAVAEELAAEREGLAAKRDERKALEEELEAATSERARAQIQAELDAVETSIKLSKRRRDELKRDALAAFRAEKQAALAAVAFQTAAAVLKAFAIFGPPPSPLGISAAAAAVIEGGIQAGLVASQKPPQFHAGGIAGAPSFTAGPDERNAILRQGEAVLDARTVDQVGRDRIQDALGRGPAAASSSGSEGVALFFEGRHADMLTSRALQRGGRARRAVRKAAGARPLGQRVTFGGR